MIRSTADAPSPGRSNFILEGVVERDDLPRYITHMRFDAASVRSLMLAARAFKLVESVHHSRVIATLRMPEEQPIG